MAKKRARRKSRAKSKPAMGIGRKLRIVSLNLFLFAVVTLISWYLAGSLESQSMVNMFLILTWVFGFIALAFLIVLGLLLLMKVAKKK